MDKKFNLYSKASWPVVFLGLPLVFFLSAPTPVFSRDLTEGTIMRGETAQGYQFMSGGAGTDERNEMMQQANRYDLTLAFAATSGNYLSDVNVVITDQQGKAVVNTTTAGPLFYADLPPGRYNVKVTYNDRTQEIKGAQIGNGRRVSRLFHWNVPDEQLSER
jgi:hypothetical protein